MRIAIVAQGVTDQSTLGGPGRVAAAHARELARRGHDVRVVTTDLVRKGRRTTAPTFDLLAVEGLTDGLTVHCAPARSLTWWPGSIGPVFSPEARRFVWETAAWADVVHAHEWPHATTQAARRACRRNGKSLVVQPHGSIQIRQGPRRLLHKMFNALNRPGPYVTFVAGTEREADEIKGVLGSTLAVHLLVNPMTMPSLDELDPRVRSRRVSWDCPDQARVLLYAHRIVPNKGLDLAIEALASLPDDNYLVVVGEDGGYAGFSEQCRAVARRLGLENRVRFVGPVSRTEIDEVILAADVFLLPARRDTFPMMVLHAMACGRPTVVTSTCQSVDILAGGVAVAEPTAAGFAGRLSSLGPAEAQALGYKARKIIEEQFSPLAVITRLEAIYAAVSRRPMGRT